MQYFLGNRDDGDEDEPDVDEDELDEEGDEEDDGEGEDAAEEEEGAWAAFGFTSDRQSLTSRVRVIPVILPPRHRSRPRQSFLFVHWSSSSWS